MKGNFKKINKKGLPAGRHGFSLMEVMLVVFILSTVLTVFIQVITQSIVHSLGSRDTIIAAGLAQEGTELVKNVRDNNWAQKNEVFDGLESNCKINYDYDPSHPFPCRGGSSANLYLKDDFFYTHEASSNNPLTKFSRKIVIAGDADTKTVTSYVTWENGTSDDCNVSNKCVYATITLTQWGGE